jgi:hypothetical protein
VHDQLDRLDVPGAADPGDRVVDVAEHEARLVHAGLAQVVDHPVPARLLLQVRGVGRGGGEREQRDEGH